MFVYEKPAIFPENMCPWVYFCNFRGWDLVVELRGGNETSIKGDIDISEKICFRIRFFVRFL